MGARLTFVIFLQVRQYYAAIRASIARPGRKVRYPRSLRYLDTPASSVLRISAPFGALHT